MSQDSGTSYNLRPTQDRVSGLCSLRLSDLPDKLRTEVLGHLQGNCKKTKDVQLDNAGVLYFMLRGSATTMEDIVAIVHKRINRSRDRKKQKHGQRVTQEMLAT